MTAPSKNFEDMAARIARIDEAEFAGAVVIVPPDGGEPIAFLLTDPKRDLMQFWSTAKSRVDVAHTEMIQLAQQQQQAGGGWGRR